MVKKKIKNKKTKKIKLGTSKETAREKMIGQHIGYRYDVNMLPDYKKIVGLSFGTLTDEQRIENKNSYDTIDIVLSVILVVLIIGVLSYFTG